MGSNLYSKSNKRESELLKSKESLQRLSIDYNPLNSVKQDLGLMTYQEELDLENTKRLLETELLKKKFSNRRVVEGEDVIEYCVANDYTILPVSRYRSTLSDKCLQSIKDFVSETGIDLPNYKDNFFILAPRKFFEKDNLDLGNVAFNIYYRDGYTRTVDITDKLTEIYGSDFKNSFFAPINEIMRVDSKKQNLYARGGIIMSAVMFVCFFAVTCIVAFTGGGIVKDMMIFYNIVQLFIGYIILRRYRHEFGDKGYIKRIYDTTDFLSEGKLKI